MPESEFLPRSSGGSNCTTSGDVRDGLEFEKQVLQLMTPALPKLLSLPRAGPAPFACCCILAGPHRVFS